MDGTQKTNILIPEQAASRNYEEVMLVVSHQREAVMGSYGFYLLIKTLTRDNI